MMASTSLEADLNTGSTRSPARSRRFSEMRRITAQARNEPNSRTEDVSPLASRCASAQTLIEST
ncbi:hypothetical protein D3C87_1956620 [compost metagenome]